MKRNSILIGDCKEVMAGMEPASVDLVFGSPPYENCRTYGIDFNLKGQEWVDWMVAVVKESLRVCKGLVAFVVEGKTRKFSWSGTPVLLMADLIRAGITIRNPPIFNKVGIAGSGGPDWWRNDYEFIICATNGGKLPWSDNTATGEPAKWAPGGAMSHRVSDGTKVNQWGKTGKRSGVTVTKEGGREYRPPRPSHYFPKPYDAPAIANPGNVVKCNVGGGHMGHPLAHENEAPFPESLVEPFLRCFCPPGGIVLDPFCGSGTTLAVARNHGRDFIGIDIRESQVELARKRVHGPLFAGATK